MEPSTIREARYLHGHSLLEVTLCLLVKEKQVLLARKLRKIGAGLWNGPGGRIEPGENPEQAMVREAEEELGVVPTHHLKMGELEFYFPTQPQWNMRCHVFLVTEWTGEPQTTEEMANPTWFTFPDLPWEKMWPDDKFWLPLVMEGNHIKAAFLFDQENQPIDQEIQVTEPGP